MHRALLTLACSLFICCVPSHSRHTNGVRFVDGNVVCWNPQDFPLTVSIEDSLSAEDRVALRSAMRTWNESVGLPVFTETDLSWGAIHVRKRSIQSQHPNVVLQGLAWRNYSNSRFTQCVITLAVGLEDSDVEIVFLHELGHALGLEHDSWQQSIMFSSATDSGGRIMSDDVAFIRWQITGE